ncbi:MAG: DUF1460 domain-containing protein [Phycisphaerae bacterium]|nr:DUF1460 domain-containing protein [Phycisphaerae bacterium]
MFGRAIPAVLPLLLMVLSVSRASPTVEEFSRYQDLDAREFKTFSNVELAEFLALRHKCAPPANAAEGIARCAHKAVGQPFRLNAIRFAYDEADCVVALERAVAMGLSHDWESYRAISDRLRHKNGVVVYKNRNFSTLGDWLPNNCDWLLEDITPSLPGAETFTHIVRPKRFKDVPTAEGVRTVFLGHDWKTKDTEERIEAFIPRHAIAGALNELRSGDIVLVIYGVGRRAGCDHMGLIVHDENGRVSIAHAAPPRVRIDPLTQFVDLFPRISGLMFLRVRADATEVVSELPADVPSAACQDNTVRTMRETRTKLP